MADYKTKTLSWMASLALVGTVGLAACGDEDASESTRSASAPSLAPTGFDVYLTDPANEFTNVERGRQADSARLEAAAEAYVNPRAASAPSGFDVYLADTAHDSAGLAAQTDQATEAYERQAKLDNAARTFTSIDEPEPTDDEFVPGTRRMPMR